jgi:Na+-transporting methylmalonyl-CoA/oxaloacetate decarboxylase gamma subunit
MGWDKILEGNGFGITLTGMLIVFSGLILVSFFVSMMPKIMASIERVRSFRERRAVRAAVANQGSESLQDADELELWAAIGYVIQAEMEQENLLDYQSITIRRDASQQVWAVAGKMRTLSTRM